METVEVYTDVYQHATHTSACLLVVYETCVNFIRVFSSYVIPICEFGQLAILVDLHLAHRDAVQLNGLQLCTKVASKLWNKQKCA